LYVPLSKFPATRLLPTLVSKILTRVFTINASLKDDDDIQRQVKSLYCTANELRGTFDQCSPAVKNILFRAHCMPIYACKLWSKYTQTSIKRLRTAYNNAYRSMHYIPMNVSVRPHQVSNCARTFDALLRNNLYRFFIRCASSSNFFIRSLQMSDAFYKSSFSQLLTLLHDGDQMQQLCVNCFGVRVSSVLLLCGKNMWTMCAHQA